MLEAQIGFTNARLTPTLLRTMECFSRGLDTRETACELNVNDQTVKTYTQVLAKLFNIPRGRDLRVSLAIAYSESAKNELFRIGSEVIRSQ